MGQGQEEVARRQMKRAKKEGWWLCIQNAHLGISYLQEVEQSLSNITEDTFRLWITTEPCDTFPLGLLYKGLRVTCEPPAGFKDGLLALLKTYDSDIVDDVQMPQWRPLLMSLSVMHVLVQQRKKFGSIGWNVPYEFSFSDLRASMNILSNHLQDLRSKRSNIIDWETLHYLISIVLYGGRITDARDQRLMSAYCERYLSDIVICNGINFEEKPYTSRSNSNTTFQGNFSTNILYLYHNI